MIVEEDGARILIADTTALQAATREDEQLRIYGNLQRVEGGLQKAAARVEAELCAPVLQLPVDVEHCVIEAGRGIRDGGIFERASERAGVLSKRALTPAARRSAQTRAARGTC